jgi:hypothetical protein
MTSDAGGNLGALQTQVGFLERGHSDLRNEIQAIDSKMDAGFTLLSQKLDTKTTPQWQMLSLLVGVIMSIGGALFLPVREALSEQKALTENLRREGIERDRLAEGRVVKLWDEQNKTARDLAYMQGQLHPLPPR